MSRIRLELPDYFSFSTVIPIRITDINYGNHVGNDSILSLLHEARVQYLHSHELTEKDFAGAGLILADAAIEFKKELFYAENITIWVQAANFTRVSFDLFYKIEKEGTTAVAAKTGMVCFNYNNRKVMPVPEAALLKLQPL